MLDIKSKHLIVLVINNKLLYYTTTPFAGDDMVIIITTVIMCIRIYRVNTKKCPLQLLVILQQYI